eukprot:jgi/Mesen1/10196/ME000766S09563
MAVKSLPYMEVKTHVAPSPASSPHAGTSSDLVGSGPNSSAAGWQRVPEEAPGGRGQAGEPSRSQDHEGDLSAGETSGAGVQLGEVFPGGGIACGLFHSATWHRGRLWLWGKGDGGRLGFGDEEPQYSPRLHKGLPPVRLASLGGLHTAAVTVEGGLYTWGFGGFGALGHGEYTRQISPRLVEGAWMKGGEAIVQVSAGGAHTAVVSDSGAVYTFGRDEGEGRLGHADADRSVSSPGLWRGCGGFFTAALTTEGEVYTWGGNMNGELGRTTRSADWRPRHVAALPRGVKHVACGGYHAAAIDGEGRVWTWGRGGHGQLGHESLQTEAAPRVVQRLADVRVSTVSCGGTWTAAVSEQGKLYVWGKNSECQLGVPRESGIIATPTVVSSVGASRVLDVAAGANHGLAVVLPLL